MFSFFKFVRESLTLLLYRTERIFQIIENPPVPGGDEFEPYLDSKEFTDIIIRQFRKKIISIDGVIGICEGAGNIVNTIFTLDGETTVIRHYVMLSVKNDLRMMIVESIDDVDEAI